MIIDTIKEDIIEATRSRNRIKSDILKLVLTESQKKNDTSDNFVLGVCKDFVKSIDTTKQQCASLDPTDELVARLHKMEFERTFLEKYLPKTCSKEEVLIVINGLKSKGVPIANDGKSIGLVMKECKTNGLLADSVDVRELLSEPNA